MTKALITCGGNPGVYFLEKWFPKFDFIYGDASFTAQISEAQQFVLPKVSQGDYIHELLNICLDKQIDAVFAMSFAEQELLAEATELFSEFNIQLHLPDLITRKLLFDTKSLFEKLNFGGIKTVSYQITSSFSEFSKACLQLGYPTESVAVVSLQNPELVWVLDDQLPTKSISGKPVTSFIKAAKLFAADEVLLLRAFQTSTQKTVYASFTGGKLESVWNVAETASEEIIVQIGLQLKLNGLYEITLQNEQLFGLKPFVVI